MLARLDAWLLALCAQVFTLLRDRFGINPPSLLRETLHAGTGALVIALVLFAMSRDYFSLIILALSLPFMIPTVRRLLRRYGADSQKDWSSELARDYMARALGRRESLGYFREISLVLTMGFLLGTLINGADFGSHSGLAIGALWIAGIAHEYFAAAEPGGPGDRVKKTQLQFATQAGGF